MELALTIFAGLVLFAAFGKPLARALQAVSPSLPGAFGKLLRFVPWVTTPCILGFCWLVLAEQKTWQDDQRILFFVGCGAAVVVVRMLCIFVAGVLEAVDPVVKDVGRGIFAEEQAPPKTAPASSFSVEGDDEDEQWTVDFDEMKAYVERSHNGLTSSGVYMLKRDKDGTWFARVKKKGSEWGPLEETSERLASIIETRWRKATR